MLAIDAVSEELTSGYYFDRVICQSSFMNRTFRDEILCSEGRKKEVNQIRQHPFMGNGSPNRS